MLADWTKLDVFLRGGAVGTLLLCAALFALRPGSGRKDAAISLLCLGLCAYLAVSSPGIELAGWLGAVLLAIASTVPVLVYWAALELFHDDAPLARWQLALSGLVVATAWLSFSAVSFGMIRGAIVIALFVHLVCVIAQGEAGDLVEARRRFRKWFLLAIAAMAIAITALEITGADTSLPPLLYPAHAAMFWALAAVFTVWALRVDASVWIETQGSAAPATQQSPAQTALIARIETAMSDGMWQQEGLSVHQMAQALDTQDHRLRAAINQGLGHRNFASFVNRYRIDAAKRMLRDPKQAERTVLSIAYDVGFASLGPFNRAFRSETGMSPTQYRKTEMLPP